MLLINIHLSLAGFLLPGKFFLLQNPETVVQQSPDKANGNHARYHNICPGQGIGIGNHVAHAGNTAWQHFCRHQAHSGNPQTNSQTGYYGGGRSRKKYLAEDVPFACSQGAG